MKTKLLVLLLLSGAIYGQQDTQFTQYMYNTITVNPAYAGSRGVMSVFGLHRTQWVGLEGAPTTNAFSINSPIENSNLGIGLSFVNDEIGPTVENKISVDISYTIQTSEIFKLSFGIKGMANLFDLDVNKLNYSKNDPLLMDIHNDFSPNIGAGIYLYSNNSYLGVSVPNFFEAEHYDDNSIAIYKERMHLYFIGGYVLNLNPNLKFKPAFLTKLVQGSPLQLDLSGNFLFNDKFVLGAAWRWSASVSAMVGFQVSDNIYIGYSYDLETTKLVHYNSGSHEIFLRFEILKNPNRIVSPRFF
ncbi:type IX secretion system membrane protein PorP/SprF [Mariniflexile sp. HMF6888]|uniref:type IX secretion system membrane protein PorP/SprF n=1 Tax=Mariniflexile sp. HMF6888 TaxID=3373086 RepID=UPI0037A0D4BE